ncbi:MAG TPA: methionine--tRNA ligase [Candidatus Dormibacteraeota bacterium]
MTEKFYVTTAIDYVNGRPHMGHAMEKVGADVLIRSRRARGYDTWLVLGADEHSISVRQEAAERGQTPEEFTDAMEEIWKHFWHRFQIDFSAFVRSSSDANRATTDEFMRRLHDAGHIYKSTYAGWYCTSCEQFYPEEELNPDGTCREHPHLKAQWVEEENYFFRASTFEPQVRALLERPDFLQPEERRNEMLQAIKEGLRDVSISRTFTDWGFPLPFDPQQVIYVWFDALLCYVTGIGFGDDKERFERFWPCDVHVIGKGITRFHTLMWPAMLLAAGVELPRRVYSHGYITMGGEKMSKSRGLFFDPAQLVDVFGSDGARYVMARMFPFGRDTDFELEACVDRFNADLANDFGNLANRALSLIGRYREGVVGQRTPEPPDLRLAEIVEATTSAIDRFAFDEALKEAWRLVVWANKHIDENAPWQLAKNPADNAALDAVLYRAVEVLRLLTHLLGPYIPAACAELARRLGGDAAGTWEAATAWGGIQPGTRVESGPPLFPRLDKAAVLAGD